MKENGTEVSRTAVNTSTYRMVPKTTYIGVATGSSSAYNEMVAAIGTGSLDHVRNVIAILTAPKEEVPVEPPAEQPPTEQPPAEQPSAEQPPAEQPSVEQPPAEQPPI